MSDRGEIQRERLRSLRVAAAPREENAEGNAQENAEQAARPPQAEETVSIEIDETPEVVAIEVEEVAIEIEEVDEAPEPPPPPRHEPPPPPPRRTPPPPPPPRRSRTLEPLAFLSALAAGLSRGLDLPVALDAAAGALPTPARRTTERVAARLRGEYSQDEWGYDEEFVDLVRPFFDFMYERWWRVKAVGTEHLPAHGPAMIVANHAGVLPWDATMMSVAIFKHHSLPRQPRFMVLDWAFRLPWVSSFMRRVGGVVASPYNAMRLLDEGHLVMVFPEGAKGAGKPFAQRYQLQRFGRGGFVEIALRTGAPIVPVAVVGSEEIYPKLGESRLLARLIGAPYVPLTPTFPALGALGAVPLPSKWRIEFCPPIDLSSYGPETAENRSEVLELSERVRETIQQALLDNLVKRGSAFF
jgi:1-acyl-sn-glycerol-3-phosphate acyltransferase